MIGDKAIKAFATKLVDALEKTATACSGNSELHNQAATLRVIALVIKRVLESED